MSNKERKDMRGFKAFYWRQFSALFWMFAGIAGAMTFREVLPWIKEHISYATMLLIGGVLGILVPNLIHFGQAGKVITRGENAATNLIVGASLTLLFLLVGLILSRFLF